MLAREVAQSVTSILSSRLEEASFSMLGVGGAGINVLMEVSPEIPLRRVAVDTDEYFLELCAGEEKLDLGRPLLEGKGTGGQVELGRSAALLHRSELEGCLGDGILLLAAGLGRGTGTGAAPVIASIARERGVPVLAFLIWPFRDERITTKARRGLRELRRYCDAVMVLDNDRARDVSGVSSHWEAATVVNSMMARMVERIVERVSEAFPFSVEEEIADFVGGLPAAEEGVPLRTAELGFEPEMLDPVAMDSRGMIQLR
jgi:cell division protein FtsZ